MCRYTLDERHGVGGGDEITDAQQLVSHNDELTLLVTRIRATGPSHSLTSPSARDITAVVAHLEPV